MIWLLADDALKSTAVLMICSAAAWNLRDHSAAVRHSVWSAALATIVFLGPLSMVTPMVTIPLYPRAPAVGAIVEGGRLAGPTRSSSDSAPTFSSAGRASGLGRPGGTAPAISGSRVTAAVPLIWLIGSLILLARIVLSRIRLSRLRRDAAPVADPRVQALAEEVGRKIGLRCAVELLSSSAVLTPVAFGVLRPAVMLPIGSDSWSLERLRNVLIHELSHVRRRDPLTQIVAELARAVHWYNPLAWYSVGRLMLERERACDDEVVQGGARGVDYADHLLSMAKRVVHRRAYPKSVLSMAEVAGLKVRVTALLTPTLRRGRLTRTQRCLVVANSIVAVCALAPVTGARQDGVGVSHGVQSARPGGTAAWRPPPPPQPQSRPPDVTLHDTTAPGLAARPFSSQVTDVNHPSVQAEQGIGDLLADPRSELVVLTNPRADWPSEQEIRSSKERDFIMRLQVAADHEKRSEYDLVRERAEWALTRVRQGEIVAPLVESLEDRDWRIQAYAAWALAVAGAPEAIPSIRRLLDHSNWRVRAQAASSLLELQSPLPIEALHRLARDPAWQVRISVVEFLRRSNDPEARRLLDQMHDDPHGGIRMQVEAALSESSAR